MPVPVGAVTVILPVATEQVGWTVVATGAVGAAGAALMVTDVAVEIQPEAFLAVTLYVPAATPVKVADAW